VSGTDSVSQPPEESVRQTNRTRRPAVRKSPRAKFPLLTQPEPQVHEALRGSATIRGADLDTSDPTAGGGRGFEYEWERQAQVLETQIAQVAAGGGGGGAGASFTYHQTVAAATWVIDHHLGFIPNVLILDNSGQQLIAEIRHPSDQTTVVVHSAPYSGTAYLRS
jgi:hypothetical protein